GFLVHMAAGESDTFAVGAAVALAAMLVGGWVGNLTSAAGQARRQELPAIFERLERALAPHSRRPPTGPVPGRGMP
ncbi:MAG TPA: hypothetical protein VIC87_03585, partial [Vicinamibacteria bacterium]